MANQNRTQNANQSRKEVPKEDFNLKETSPALGGSRIPGGGGGGGGRASASYDLVEEMHYLYLKVVKAKELPSKDGNDGCLPHPYVQTKLGLFTGETKHFENNSNPEWNMIFAFPNDRIQSNTLEVLVRDKDKQEDDLIGKITFEINEIPGRVTPDSPLAPQWYTLENNGGEKVKGELMCSVWMGTQADNAFSEAFHLDSASIVNGDGVSSIKSKVYLSPRLWYLRVNVIEAEDVMITDKNKQKPEIFVRVSLGKTVLKTGFSSNMAWNQDLMFVAAEPFEERLVLSVEEKLGGKKEEVLGKCFLGLQSVEKRLDQKGVAGKWFGLEKHTVKEDGATEVVKLGSRVHLRVCLDGGYHVLDELTQYSSDFRASAKQLWRPGMGMLELGIISAQGLPAMKKRDGHATTDAYCVAKYGQKWIRTRTITGNINPKWNEQYTWEVFDPCTVVTITVFDNCHLQGVDNGGRSPDSRIGKVRIRLSTLEIGRVYTHSYPLIVLQPSGVKKMGEIQLAVRFSCSSLINMFQQYFRPILPKMHYLYPMSIFQADALRHQATQVLSAKLSRAEPPLRKEVVEYMLDVGSNAWSVRRSKANWSRVIRLLSGFLPFFKYFDQVCSWRSNVISLLVHVVFLVLVYHPEWIPVAGFLLQFVVGVVKYKDRPRNPTHMDIKLSCADSVTNDCFDEEFDSFPTSKSGEVLKFRYNRLRDFAARVQTMVGDLANHGERLGSLLSWRDPRATAVFLVFCLVASMVVYAVSFRFIVIFAGFYVMRHPVFRQRVPSAPVNFFKRLPTKSDCLL